MALFQIGEIMAKFQLFKISDMQKATSTKDGIMSKEQASSLSTLTTDVTELKDKTTITDEQYTAMMEEIFGGQLGSGGGSVGTTTTITDEQVTAGMNEIFGEGNWSE